MPEKSLHGPFLEAFRSPAAILDGGGVILSTNRAWKHGRKGARLSARFPLAEERLNRFLKSRKREVRLDIVSDRRNHFEARCVRFAQRPVRILVTLEKRDAWAPSYTVPVWISLLENTADYILIVDRDGRIQFINHTVPGLTKKEALGHTIYEFQSPEMDIRSKKAIQAAFKEGKTSEFESSALGPHGTVAWYRSRFVPVKTGRRVTSVCVIASDVTSQKMIQEELRVSEERFRQLAENIREVFWMIDAETLQILYVSPAFKAIWGTTMPVGLPAPETPWAESLHEEDRERVLRNLAPENREKEWVEEYRIRLPDGSIRWILDRAFPIRDAEGRVTRIGGVADDVTARKEMERELLEVGTREQKRIGQDLHDGLGQDLTGIAFLSKALQKRLIDTSPSGAEEARKLSELVNKAIARTRALARGLAPAGIEEGSLQGALEELAADTGKVFDVRCSFEGAGKTEIDDDLAAAHLYHIAQEAVTNSVRHARPSRIDIDLNSRNGQIILTVSDDGRGIGEERGKGIGLRIMKARADAIGGSLRVGSNGGRGTRVECIFEKHRVSDG